MTNIIINGDITGSYNHIGHNYNNYNSYIVEKKELNFTETEKKLVKIIFDNTSSEEERNQILNSLENIRSEIPTKEKEKDLNQIKNFIGNLGKKLTENGLTELITAYVKNCL